MEKTITRLKSNLKARRKLSLPMLVGQLPWNNGPLQQDSAETATSLVDEVITSDSEVAVDDVKQVTNETQTRAWLSFGKSRQQHKNRKHPRRWPSTPTFMAPPPVRSATLHLPGAGGARPQPYIQGYHLTLPAALHNRSDASAGPHPPPNVVRWLPGFIRASQSSRRCQIDRKNSRQLFRTIRRNSSAEIGPWLL